MQSPTLTHTHKLWLIIVPFTSKRRSPRWIFVFVEHCGILLWGSIPDLIWFIFPLNILSPPALLFSYITLTILNFFSIALLCRLLFNVLLISVASSSSSHHHLHRRCFFFLSLLVDDRNLKIIEYSFIVIFSFSLKRLFSEFVLLLKLEGIKDSFAQLTSYSITETFLR